MVSAPSGNHFVLHAYLPGLIFLTAPSEWKKTHYLSTSSGTPSLTQVLLPGRNMAGNPRVTHMKATVRHEMTEGITAYEEKPRNSGSLTTQLRHPSDLHPHPLSSSMASSASWGCQLTHASGQERLVEGHRRDQGIVSHGVYPAVALGH